jgi:hypothetical protein
MEIAGYLTFLGLLIAAYSILKTHERLYIRLRLSLLDKIVIPIFAVIIFLSIIFSGHVKDYDKEIIFSKFKLKLSFMISASAYLFLLLISIYILIKINFNRLKRKKINLFYKLTKELLNKKEYPTLIEILDEEYRRLIKYSSKLSWLNNIKHKLLSFFSLKVELKLSPEDVEKLKKTLEEIGERFEIEEKELTRKERIKKLLKHISLNLRHYIGKLLRFFIPEVRDKSKERSRYLLHTLLSNNDFVSEMITIKPELGLKLFNKEFYNYYEYVDIFFYELMNNNKSILYYEIKNNENLCDYHRYRIQEDNLILRYLFEDCKVAQRLEVYRGVGDYVLDYLLDLNKQEIDLYNYGYENFEKARWKSSIFVGIRFFDIMISEAIYQGIKDHMFLFYFRHFTESILNNFKYIPKVWEEPHEWNTRYTYLLDEIVHTLCNWVDNIRYERFNYAVKLLKDDHQHENANIIKSSIICLIEVLDLIARDEKVPEKFKREQANSVIKLLFELKTSDLEIAIRYGNVVFNCIKFYMKFPMKLNKKFYKLLKNTYEKFDKTHFILGHKREKGSQLDEELHEYLGSIYDNSGG